MSPMHVTERTRNAVAAGELKHKEESELFVSLIDEAKRGQGTKKSNKAIRKNKQRQWTLQPGAPFRAAPFVDILLFASDQVLVDGDVWVDVQSGLLCFVGTLLTTDERTVSPTPSSRPTLLSFGLHHGCRPWCGRCCRSFAVPFFLPYPSPPTVPPTPVKPKKGNFTERVMSREFDLRMTQVAPYICDGVATGLTLTEVSTSQTALAPDPEVGPLWLQDDLICPEASLERKFKYDEWQESGRGVPTETKWDARIWIEELSEEETERFRRTGETPPLRDPFLPSPVAAPKIWSPEGGTGEPRLLRYQLHRAPSTQPLLLAADAMAVPGSFSPGGPFAKEPPVVGQTARLVLNTAEEYEAVVLALREAEERMLVAKAAKVLSERGDFEAMMALTAGRGRARGGPLSVPISIPLEPIL